MDWSFSSPTAFRINSKLLAYPPVMEIDTLTRPHDSHPSLPQLLLLVFSAVLQVVCVSLPGYVIARLGHFDADQQKFVANLNVMLFTPCLIFHKLASQLNASKLIDLGIIPCIFIIQTIVSYSVSILVAKACRLRKRPTNFITAMGVFGNSNSLPISLVISLSQTLKGLHWDRIPGDNDNEVAARGILYLLIFQQLGQMVRWSWGYHVLLAPKHKYGEYEQETVEEGYRDEFPPVSRQHLISGLDGNQRDDVSGDTHSEFGSEVYEPAGRTPVAGASRTSPADSEDDEAESPRKRQSRLSKKHQNGKSNSSIPPFPTSSTDDLVTFPRMRDVTDADLPGMPGYAARAKLSLTQNAESFRQTMKDFNQRAFDKLPQSAQTSFRALRTACSRLYHFMVEFMNPPLWAMIIAITVASIPNLQRLFFQKDTFIKNSVTNAISSSASVAVPLILVVLGANLARNTQSQESGDLEEDEIGTRLLVASLVSRMVIPTIIMAPILALFAKYVPISILDDPIFVIVCFLLVGAPSALQLAQICQINSVYERTMSKILFQSYVIWIMPSTLALVMMALEVLEWAKT